MFIIESKLKITIKYHKIATCNLNYQVGQLISLMN